MGKIQIETPRLWLVLKSLDECRAGVAAMSDADRAFLSAEWLGLLASATTDDPWVLGFSIVRREDQTTVGQCGFKGPPTVDGIVEIAYGLEPSEQGKGYATEAALALTELAFRHNEVQLVRAHTLPNSNASPRVLTKCGFQHVGSVVDPEDGLVWRWELSRTEGN